MTNLTTTNLKIPNSGDILSINAAITSFSLLNSCYADNVLYLSYGPSGFNIRNSSGTNAMFILNNGYVGIGNTNPSCNLDITGNARFTGSLNVSGITNTGNIPTSNNLYMGCDGAQSIYCNSGSNIIGRLFGTTQAIYFDFYNHFNLNFVITLIMH